MIIEARSLRKRFRVRTRAGGAVGALRGLLRRRWRPVTAVDDVDLAVAPGEMIAFIGPNGAGKSTTIKLLTGILQRDAGAVSVLGLDPQRQRRRLAYRIGTVFGQKSQLWFHLPPLDTFALLADVYDLEPRQARRRIAALTEVFDIGRHLATPVRKLSRGERIRCEIAAALIHDPESVVGGGRRLWPWHYGLRQRRLPVAHHLPGRARRVSDPAQTGAAQRVGVAHVPAGYFAASPGRNALTTSRFTSRRGPPIRSTQ